MNKSTIPSSSWQDYAKQVKRDPVLKSNIAKASRAIDVGMQIYEVRKKKGLTQTQLAERVGVSQPNVSRLESGDYKGYTLRTLNKVAQALDVELGLSLAEPSEKLYPRLSDNDLNVAIKIGRIAGRQGRVSQFISNAEQLSDMHKIGVLENITRHTTGSHYLEHNFSIPNKL